MPPINSIKTKMFQLVASLRELEKSEGMSVFCSFTVRGRSQTMLTRRGRWVGGTGNVNGMQIFSWFILVKEFLHKCQQGVGRWSIMGKILST